MILPDFIVPSRVNQQWTTSGIDSPELCHDRFYYDNYPHTVEYCYNSRGYRDSEWPDDLASAVWVFGDSFTVGIGQPAEHTWPYLLSQALGQRVINVSMDGASNPWISRKFVAVASEIKPKLAVVQWSYIHRREHTDSSVSDESRIRHYAEGATDQDDLASTMQAVKQAEALTDTTQLIHTVIPYPAPDSIRTEFDQAMAKTCCYYVPEFHPLDWARDSHHYGRRTAQKYVDSIMSILASNATE